MALVKYAIVIRIFLHACKISRRQRWRLNCQQCSEHSSRTKTNDKWTKKNRAHNLYAKQMVQHCEHWVMPSSIFIRTTAGIVFIVRIVWVFYSMAYKICQFSIVSNIQASSTKCRCHRPCTHYTYYIERVLCTMYDTFCTMEMNEVLTRALSTAPRVAHFYPFNAIHLPMYSINILRFSFNFALHI